MERDNAPARRRQPATVFDAVAGRVGYESFLTGQRPSKYRDTSSNANTAVPPDEVLFRRRGAPARYEEDDIYNADRHLTAAQTLPDSDLLKVIHAFASDFYAGTAPSAGHGGGANGVGENDYRSLDETALLAMGILLEEAARKALGPTGHLALVERRAEEMEATQPPRHGAVDRLTQIVGTRTSGSRKRTRS